MTPKTQGLAAMLLALSASLLHNPAGYLLIATALVLAYNIPLPEVKAYA